MPASDDLTDAEAATIELIAKIKGQLEKKPLRRADYVQALSSIAEFLAPFLGTKATYPLLCLVLELYDLDQGKVGALVAPARHSRRPPNSSVVSAQHAHDAAALECLVRCGEPVEIAARRIARRRGYSHSKVMHWRAELSSRPKSALAKIVFEEYLKRIEELDNAGRRDLAEVLIEQGQNEQD
jgi:hypothetical protein